MERSSPCEFKKSHVGAADILPAASGGSCILLWSRGRVLANCLAPVPAPHPINALSDSAINLLVWVTAVWEQREPCHFLLCFGLSAEGSVCCMPCTPQALLPPAPSAQRLGWPVCALPLDSSVPCARSLWGQGGSERLLGSGTPDGNPSSELWGNAQLGGHKTLQSPGREGQDSTPGP